MESIHYLSNSRGVPLFSINNLQKNVAASFLFVFKLGVAQLAKLKPGNSLILSDTEAELKKKHFTMIKTSCKLTVC